jgi:hypothetical protein
MAKESNSTPTVPYETIVGPTLVQRRLRVPGKRNLVSWSSETIVARNKGGPVTRATVQGYPRQQNFPLLSAITTTFP